MNKEKNYSKKSYFITHGAVLALLLVIVILANVLTARWDSALTDFFGTVGGTKTTAQAGDFLSEYKTEEELKKAQLDFTSRVVGEGTVLLKNSNDALPMKAGAKVSVFGIASRSASKEGSGSGDIKIDSDTLSGALEKAGFAVNSTLTAFTAASKHAHGTGAGPGNGTAMGEWKIDEIPQSEYTENVKASYASYGDAAIVIFSRQNGEGSDLPRDVSRFGNAEGRHYLELSVEEEDLLRAIHDSGAFGRVVVIINAANPMELGFLDKEEYGVDACLWHAGLGTDGIHTVVGILSGGVNPSGRLVDSYAYDSWSSPVMQNFGDFRYVDADGKATGYSYMNYAEGIYMGYRYYETRYEDAVMGTENVGTYDYASTVQFPFGFGLSYTSFEWSGFKAELKDDVVTASVNVKNTGSMAGKDVVEIYVQAPYTAGGVEKASVVLAGYGKTKELKAGESEKVTVTFNMKDIASYDFMQNKTWILDAGTYYITAGRMPMTRSTMYSLPRASPQTTA